jgi:hypothetical protein
MLVGSIGDRVLTRACGRVDQRPQVGRARQVQGASRGSTTPVAPGRQHGVGVRRSPVEAQGVAEVGDRVPEWTALPSTDSGHAMPSMSAAMSGHAVPSCQRHELLSYSKGTAPHTQSSSITPTFRPSNCPRTCSRVRLSRSDARASGSRRKNLSSSLVTGAVTSGPSSSQFERARHRCPLADVEHVRTLRFGATSRTLIGYEQRRQEQERAVRASAARPEASAESRAASLVHRSRPLLVVLPAAIRATGPGDRRRRARPGCC